MKTKTLSLITILASLLVTGCNGNNDSSKNSVNNGSNTNSNVVTDPDTPAGYSPVLTSKEAAARTVPADMGLEARKDLKSAFSTDPTTFDYLSNNKQTNSEYYANFVDNLLEHDQYGNIRGALAKGAYYNSDFTRLRFKLREGVMWVDNSGNEIAEVVADDFAAGLQHLLDAKGGAETLAYYIVGAKDYAYGLTDNFDTVGFVQYSKYDFEYILAEPCPFFHTFFEYTAFLPMNREFFEGLGGAFGAEWNPSDCDFGMPSRPQTLLYCGPYILTNYSSAKELKMVKNTKYWDIGNVQIDTVTYTYNSGSSIAGLVELFKQGELSSLGVNNQNYDLVEKDYADCIYEQGTGTTTYYFNWNLNRQTYAVGDCKSAKTTDTEKANTRKAILNENFRKAVFSALPKIQMNALIDDNATAEVSIRNTYTTPEFVSISQNVSTTNVNHTAAEGQYYQMLNKEMKALNEINNDTYAMYKTEWDATEGKEYESDEESTFADREDSYYNETTAKGLKRKAKEELEAEGVTFPIMIDYLVYTASDAFLLQSNLVKAKLESILGTDFIQVNLQSTANVNNYENSHFLAASGADMNFDLSSGTGWGPDYGDPATFLNTLSFEGDLYNNLGLDSRPEDEEIYYSVLGDYQAAYEDACDPSNDVNLRYAKMAAAEAELLSSAVIMPNTTDGGGYAVSRIVPRTNQRTFYGTDDSRFKYMILVDEVITKEQRNQIIADWDAQYKANFSEN